MCQRYMYCFRISCRFLRFSRNLFSGRLWDLNLLLSTSDPCVRYFEPPSPPQQHYRNICKTFFQNCPLSTWIFCPHFSVGKWHFTWKPRLENDILPEYQGWKMAFYLNISVGKWHFTWISRLENDILPESQGSKKVLLPKFTEKNCILP